MENKNHPGEWIKVESAERSVVRIVCIDEDLAVSYNLLNAYIWFTTSKWYMMKLLMIFLITLFFLKMTEAALGTL